CIADLTWFLLQSYGSHQDLHSFPTRRSSDLGAMRHVNLDPVGAVLDLLARDLAHLHWTVAELRAFWDHNVRVVAFERVATGDREDRKSTRLNSSHRTISYAVFCLKKKIKTQL